MELLIFGLVIFIFLSACFSGFESGIISINQANLQVKVEQGNKAAKILQDFRQKPEQMLSLILLGNNTCIVLTTILAIQVSKKFPVYEYKHIVVAVSTTLILLIFAEILPKLWFRQKPLERSLFLAYLMCFFDKLTAFFTKRVAKVIQSLQKPKKLTFEQRKKIKHQKCEDFLYLLEQSQNDKNISNEVAHLLKMGLEFYNMKAKDLMTPYDEVVAIDSKVSVVEIVNLGYNKNISRFPVYKDKKSNWIGVLSIYDAIFYFEKGDWEILKVENLMRPLPNISQELTLDDILLKMQEKSQPLFAVNNKQKDVVGVVSATDIIRPLLGEMA